MADLYASMTGEQPIQADSPEYQRRIVTGAQRTLAPQYAQAIRQARQSASNRGLYNSPVGMMQENQVGQEYRNKLFDVGQQASVKGADEALQDRRSAIAREFAMQQQRMAYDQQNSMNDRAREDQGNAMWANLLSSAAGGVGGIAGKLLFNSLQGGGDVPDSLAPSQGYIGLPDDDAMNRYYQQAAASARSGRK